MNVRVTETGIGVSAVGPGQSVLTLDVPRTPIDPLLAEAEALARLNEASARLWRVRRLEDGLDEMLSAVIDLLGADMGNVQLIDADARVLHIAAHTGYGPAFLEFFRTVASDNESACGRALRKRERIIVEDTESDPEYAPFRDIARITGYRSVQSTPITGRDGTPLGMLSTHWRTPYRPDEQQLRRLDLYVRQAAGFIERCWVDEALRAAEARYRALVDSQASAACRFRPDGTILFANQAYAALFNTSVADLAGRSFWDFVAEEDRAFVRAMLERMTPANPEVTIENRLGTAYGMRWTLWINRALRFDADGRVLEAQSTGLDITERKSAEDLRERLAAVVEGSDDAIFTKDLDGKITTWNRAAERMFGYSAEEAIGQPGAILYPEGHADEEPSLLEAIRRGERIHHYETRRRTRSGQILAVSLTLSPIRDSAGNVVGASKIVRDITAQKRAEEELREQALVLELLNTTGAAIAAELDSQALVKLVTDATTRLSGARYGAFFYNFTNERGESFLLYALSGAEREPLERIGLPRNTPLFDATFRGQGVVRSADITKDPRYGQMGPHHGMPEGHLPVRSYLAVPVVSRSGEAIGGLFFGHPEPDVFTERSEKLVVGVAAQAAIAFDNARLYEAANREIARRERAEAALREADRRKDDFLAQLAHELRNPLAPIRAAAQILELEDPSRQRHEFARGIITRQVANMARLIEDLVDISRIRRGKLELRRQRVDLKEVIASAVETSRPIMENQDQRLLLSLPSRALHVDGDPVRLAQVFANLLNNAARYSPHGSSIELTLTEDAGEAAIAVRDQGIGIPPDMLSSIWEPFVQVGRPLERAQGGLGIGLTLVRSLVEMHDGRVSAHSEGESRGAEFRIRLPLVQAPRAVSGIPSAVQEVARNCIRRILIADDNEDALQSQAILLRAMGHEVRVARDGSEAVEVARSFRPHLVLLDLGMPRLNGFDAARAIRAEAWGHEVRLVALSGWGQEEDRQRAHQAGFDDHLVKPAEFRSIANLIESLGQRPDRAR